jgi:GTPase SAR1 family protein
MLINNHTYRKLVIIGDGACGKTSLLSVFTLGYFPTVSCNLKEALDGSIANSYFPRSITLVGDHPRPIHCLSI